MMSRSMTPIEKRIRRANYIYKLNRRIETLTQRIAILESGGESEKSKALRKRGALETIIIMGLGAVIITVIFYQSGVFY